MCSSSVSNTCSVSVGSSLGGWFLKQLRFYVGLRVELNVNGETVLTAPIFSLSICPTELTWRA